MPKSDARTKACQNKGKKHMTPEAPEGTVIHGCIFNLQGSPEWNLF